MTDAFTDFVPDEILTAAALNAALRAVQAASGGITSLSGVDASAAMVTFSGLSAQTLATALNTLNTLLNGLASLETEHSSELTAIQNVIGAVTQPPLLSTLTWYPNGSALCIPNTPAIAQVAPQSPVTFAIVPSATNTYASGILGIPYPTATPFTLKLKIAVTGYFFNTSPGPTGFGIGVSNNGGDIIAYIPGPNGGMITTGGTGNGYGNPVAGMTGFEGHYLPIQTLPTEGIHDLEFVDDGSKWWFNWSCDGVQYATFCCFNRMEYCSATNLGLAVFSSCGLETSSFNATTDKQFCSIVGWSLTLPPPPPPPP